MRDGRRMSHASRSTGRVRARDAVVWWTRLVRRYNIIVVIAALILSAAALQQTIAHLEINTSTLDMLDDDLAFRRNYERLDAAFPQDHRLIVIVVEGATPEKAADAARRLAEALTERSQSVSHVFYPEADPFFRRNALLYLSAEDLRQLADRLAEAQPMLAALAQDTSLRGINDLLTLALGNVGGAPGGMPASLEDALNRIASVVEKTRRGEAASLSWRQLLQPPDTIDDEQRRKIIVVEPVLDFQSLQPAAAAVADIRALVDALGLAADDSVSVRLTGEILMLQEELRSVKSNIGIVGLISFALVLGLLVIGLGSWRLFAATAITLVIGLIWTGWLATLAVGAFNLVSVTFAILFIGLSVDFGIHYSLRCKELLARGLPCGLAVDEAAAAIAGGLVLSALSAAIGFLSFVPTDFKGLAELGIIAAIGMGVALFCNLTVLPALIQLWPPNASEPPRRVGAFSRLQMLPERRPKTVAAAAALIALAAIATLPWARFNDSALDLRDPHEEATATMQTLLNDPRVDPFRALILADDASQAQALKERLAALPEVRTVLLPGDLVPENHEAKLAIIDEMAFFLSPLLAPDAPPPPATPGAMADALIKLRAVAATAADDTGSAAARRLADALAGARLSDSEVTALQTALIGDFPGVLGDLREGLTAQPFGVTDLPKYLLDRRVTPDGRVLMEIFASHDQRDHANRVQFADAVRAVAPDASGESIMLTESGRTVIRSFFEAGAYASILIVVLLLVVLRSVVDTVIVVVPLVLAGLLTVATGVVVDIPFNFANVIVLPLLFGLGVASGIHMILRMRDGNAASLIDTSTPRAVLFSALTTVGSFGSLAISAHPGLASMGQLLTIAIVFTTLCTIAVLPALRRSLKRAHAPVDAPVGGVARDAGHGS
jgi:uncharacterized protein